ncbi:MAG TPA: membrane dipeptidase [Blastocatellia bacterium]|nr:membrane dipeptidase [Blastocatellia bacterium]
MSNHCWAQSRREFLSTIPLSLLACAKTNSAPVQLQIPYVDGLCLNVPDTKAEDIAASGLTALIADVSAVSPLKTADGSSKYTRSFDACTNSINQATIKLHDHKTAFIATKGSDIATARKTKRTAVFLQFQGCEPLGEDLSRIDFFYERRLRILQITHHNNNAFGGGCIEKQWSGLTKLGIAAVEKMNAVGMIPDLSHASHLTALEVLKASKKPVILSHGACRALVNNARCAPDEVIRGIADSGGAMGIFMMSFWLTNDPTPTIDALIAQLRHVINVGGIDTAAIANDYDIGGEANLVKLNNDNAKGIKGYLMWWQQCAKEGILGFDKEPSHVVIPELNHLRRMFTIHAALEKHKFKPAEIEKIMGGNWIRVLTESL